MCGKLLERKDGVFDKADNRGFLIRFVNERDFCLANNGISRRVPALRELGARGDASWD
jgi:hypothetical protein